MITRQQAIDALDRHDNEIAQRLREGQQGVAEATEALIGAKEIRAGIIEEAIAAGWSMTKVGNVLGLSKQRIAQLRAEAGR